MDSELASDNEDEQETNRKSHYTRRAPGPSACYRCTG